MREDTFERKSNLKKLGILASASLALVVCSVAAQAGSGLVALQTAASSCRNNSGNIYVNCGNGTVTDKRTGLVWLANANCLGTVDWFTAMEFVAGLSDLDAGFCAAQGLTAAHCDCGLSDGSSPGEWRLPSADEWQAMIDNALGNGSDPDCTFATVPRRRSRMIAEEDALRAAPVAFPAWCRPTTGRLLPPPTSPRSPGSWTSAPVTSASPPSPTTSMSGLFVAGNDWRFGSLALWGVQGGVSPLAESRVSTSDGSRRQSLWSRTRW